MGEKTRLDMKIDTARPQLIDSQWVTLNCLPPAFIPKMGKLLQSETTTPKRTNPIRRQQLVGL